MSISSIQQPAAVAHKVQSSNTETAEKEEQSKKVFEEIADKTAQEKSEKSKVTEREAIEAIQRANDDYRLVNTRFEFSIHEQTKEIMVKVIDENTNETIREIPPERILDMVAKMWELAGILVDERA